MLPNKQTKLIVTWPFDCHASQMYPDSLAHVNWLTLQCFEFALQWIETAARASAADAADASANDI